MPRRLVDPSNQRPGHLNSGWGVDCLLTRFPTLRRRLILSGVTADYPTQGQFQRQPQLRRPSTFRLRKLSLTVLAQRAVSLAQAGAERFSLIVDAWLPRSALPRPVPLTVQLPGSLA